MTSAHTPKITVLMPVFNGERYLVESVDSILDQSVKDFEFLIVDDGSTDDSAAILNRYVDPRIRLISNEKNKGLIYSLNRGLKLARGDYVARMDCDDLSLPRRLECQFNFMESNPDVVVCGCFTQTFGGGGKARIGRYPLKDDLIRSWMLFGSPFAHPGVMLRRKQIVENNLFYRESYIHTEDYDLWSRISHTLKMANVPEVLLKYRRHKGQISSAFRDIQRANSDNVRLSLFKMLEVAPSSEELDLHIRIAHRRPEASLAFIDDVEGWLMKLLSANRVTKQYQDAAFLEILGNFWWETCFNASALGMTVWRRFRESKLARHARIDLKHQAAFVVRCLIKHKKSHQKIVG